VIDMCDDTEITYIVYFRHLDSLKMA
jgi:hypothetical protein